MKNQKSVEVDFSLFPVINVILSGNVTQRSLLHIARDLRDELEAIPNVLNVDIAGDREETVEIIVNPLLIESYDISMRSILDLLSNNNLLVAAGAVKTASGKFSVKLQGLLEDIGDILSLPVKVSGEAVITVADIATIRKTFKDPEGFAHVKGKPAVVLEVSKRTGKNIIETIQKVKERIEKEKNTWPGAVSVVYSQDTSQSIMDMLSDLQNNIILAILLVMAVVIAFIGVRSSALIALSIPGSFLIGILIISFFGATLNIVVLFSLILSIGMLVDAAIVVCEYADRKMLGGVESKKAYVLASQAMKWPIIASTITTLLVFLPLLFWPGIVGQFMKFLPMTLIATLSGSLLMALIFLPTLGRWIGKAGSTDEKDIKVMHAVEQGDIKHLSTPFKRYVSFLSKVLDRAGLFVTSIIIVLLMVYVLYGVKGAGVEFFPKIEPENSQLLIHARGNLSVYEKDKVVKEIASKIYDMDDEIRIFYVRSGTIDGKNYSEDTIGVIQLEFDDWNKRRKADAILEEIKERTKSIGGVVIEALKEQHGPSQGKPIVIELQSDNLDDLVHATKQVEKKMLEFGGFINIQDTRSIPAIEWRMEINREKAARFQADVNLIGNFIQLVTKGFVVTSYRPDETNDEVDITIRFPKEKRNLTQLELLRVVTPEGAIPMSNFITREPASKVGIINRVGGKRVITIESDLEPGILVDDKVKEMMKWYGSSSLKGKIKMIFKGEEEEQNEAKWFLTSAFILALAAMALVLLIQFNSIYKMLVIMSAVFLSTVGVLLGLLLTNQPFGIVMCGVGIIALSGIVVNNNIIFIDTFVSLRRAKIPVREALIQVGIQRVRAILLTAGTTVLGLLPMVLGMNINFITREVAFGSPSSQWWKQLSTTISGGLLFATILTLFFTPALLLLEDRITKGIKRMFHMKQ